MTRRTTCVTPPAFPATSGMFRRIVTSALFAGFAAGLIAAALQIVFVQPILLHAELYESGELAHFGADTTNAHAQVVTGGFNPLRDGLSALFYALTYVGYSLILVALMALASERGQTINARRGLIWGIAGFVATLLAPGFGLPPELPGNAAAEVAARQVWWFGTVGVTGLGLWLIAFGRSWAVWGIAVALLLLPHLIGAPEPETLSGPVPPEIAGHFAARVLGTGLAIWCVLGLSAAYFWQRHGENT